MSLKSPSGEQPPPASSQPIVHCETESRVIRAWAGSVEEKLWLQVAS